MSKPPGPGNWKIKITDHQGKTTYQGPSETDKKIGNWISGLIDAFFGKK